MRNGAIIKDNSSISLKFFEMQEKCCSKKEKSNHLLWGHFVIIVMTNYRNSAAHMAAPWYNAIYKLSNFVVAVVIRGVWSYDCGSGVRYLITRAITKLFPLECPFRFSLQQWHKVARNSMACGNCLRMTTVQERKQTPEFDWTQNS